MPRLPTPRCIWVEILLFIYLFPQLIQLAKSVPRVHPLWKAEKILLGIGKLIFEIRKKVLCKHLCLQYGQNHALSLWFYNFMYGKWIKVNCHLYLSCSKPSFHPTLNIYNLATVNNRYVCIVPYMLYQMQKDPSSYMIKSINII